MALTNDEKRALRAQVAAHLSDMKNTKFFAEAKPEAQEYYGFIALRLAKKLRLDKDTAKGDPVPTKEATPKVLNAMDLRPDLKAVKTAQAKAKTEAAARKPRLSQEAKAAKAIEASTNALVEEIIATPTKKRVSQKAA